MSLHNLECHPTEILYVPASGWVEWCTECEAGWIVNGAYEEER